MLPALRYVDMSMKRRVGKSVENLLKGDKQKVALAAVCEVNNDDAQVVVQFRPFDAISSASFQLRLRPGQNKNRCHPLFSKRFLPMALLLIGHDNADWYVWKAWVWKVVTAVTPAGVRFILNR